MLRVERELDPPGAGPEIAGQLVAGVDGARRRRGTRRRRCGRRRGPRAGRPGRRPAARTARRADSAGRNGRSRRPQLEAERRQGRGDRRARLGDRRRHGRGRPDASPAGTSRSLPDAPIPQPPRRGRRKQDGPARRRASPGRPVERSAAEQVDVEVVDGLAAPPADVRHEPVAGVGDALAPRDLGGRREQPAEHRAVAPSVRSAAEAMWSRGITRMWVGARGAMSRNATTSSSSWTFVDGIVAGDDLAEQAVGISGHRVLRRATGRGRRPTTRRRWAVDGIDADAADRVLERPGRRPAAAATSVWSAAWPTHRPSASGSSNSTSPRPRRGLAAQRARASAASARSSAARRFFVGSSTWPAIRTAGVPGRAE